MKKYHNILFDVGTQELIKSILVSKELCEKEFTIYIDKDIESQILNIFPDGKFPIYVKLRYVPDKPLALHRVTHASAYLFLTNGDRKSIITKLGSRLTTLIYLNEFERYENQSLYLIPRSKILKILKPDMYIDFVNYLKTLVNKFSIEEGKVYLTTTFYIYEGVKEEKAKGRITPSKVIDFYRITIPFDLKKERTLTLGEELKKLYIQFLEYLWLDIEYDVPTEVIVDIPYKAKIIYKILWEPEYTPIHRYTYYIKYDIWLGPGYLTEEASLKAIDMWFMEAKNIKSGDFVIPNFNVPSTEYFPPGVVKKYELEAPFVIPRIELPIIPAVYTLLISQARWLVEPTADAPGECFESTDKYLECIREAVNEAIKRPGGIPKGGIEINGFIIYPEIIENNYFQIIVKVPEWACLVETTVDPNGEVIDLINVVSGQGEENRTVVVDAFELVGNIVEEGKVITINSIAPFIPNKVEVKTGEEKVVKVSSEIEKEIENATITVVRTFTKGERESVSESSIYIGKLPGKVDLNLRTYVYTSLSKEEEKYRDHVIDLLQGSKIQLCMDVIVDKELPIYMVYPEGIATMKLVDEKGNEIFAKTLYRLDQGTKTVYCTDYEFTKAGTYKLYAEYREKIKAKVVKGKC